MSYSNFPHSIKDDGDLDFYGFNVTWGSGAMCPDTETPAFPNCNGANDTHSSAIACYRLVHASDGVTNATMEDLGFSDLESMRTAALFSSSSDLTGGGAMDLSAYLPVDPVVSNVKWVSETNAALCGKLASDTASTTEPRTSSGAFLGVFDSEFDIEFKKDNGESFGIADWTTTQASGGTNIPGFGDEFTCECDGTTIVAWVINNANWS